MSTVIFHPFAEAGLGEAPFRCIDVFSRPFSCEFCGTGIVNNFLIRDRNGRTFVVGCDCVEKTGDAVLMTEADLLKKRFEKKARDEKRAAAWAADQARREAVLDAERQRNGGLTDYEVSEKAEADRQAAFAAGNDWLLYVLKGIATDGNFLPSIIRDLHRMPASELSGRALEIVEDIYSRAVSGSRRGKAYDAAAEEFQSRL